MVHISKSCHYCGEMFDATCGASKYCSDKCHLLAGYTKSDDCWEWKYGLDKYGYGVVRLSGRRRLKAHRASYQTFVGPIPEGVMVCHKCDNPSCMNPSHLFLGSAKDNRADCVSKSRHLKGEGLYWKAKLKEADVFAIRSDSRRAVEIASDYGIDRNSVFHIKSRKTWKHI